MQRVAVLLFLVGSCLATTVVFPIFDAAADSGLQLNGQAALLNPSADNNLHLTTAEQSKVGSAFLKNSVTLANGASFSTAFSFLMTNGGGYPDEDGYGADGIVFIINSITNIVGASGGGIGYAGLGNSIGIEFDSWNNGLPSDINGNHIGIDVNGDITSVQSYAYPTPFNNENPHYAWVDYDGTTLEVRASDIEIRPVTPVLTRVMDIAAILGSSDVYVGFSAGTGGAYENHIIRSWAFSNTYQPITAPVTSVCGNGIIETGEDCDGGACCSTSCSFASASTSCRASAGPCDVAETCTGSSSSCPADSFQSSSVTCRSSAGVCDVAETCTGSSASCPADSFQSSSVTCRSPAGVCDVAETCTGSSASCPADSFQSSSVTCRASAGVCDVAETCTGSSASCPADSFQSSSVTCRPSTDSQCDPAESCTGSSASCPADVLSMSATCFCKRQGVNPKPFPDYFCAANGANQTHFYQCVYGVYAPQSALMNCAPGTVCGCASMGTECGCGGVRSPCTFAYAAPIAAC